MSESDRKVMLELEEVSISFKAGGTYYDHGVHHVLDKVSMNVYEGESLGLVGRNGVGKTTMLRIMAGILAPTSGNIKIAEGKSAALLSLGLGFKPELSGRDNAILAAMIQGATREEADGVLEDIKNFSELGDSFEMPVKNYSAGMNARLGFTTALKTEVDILLIDEVLSVGDAHFRGKALAAMEGRIASDQTVVFVSHLAEHIKKLCTRAIWLHEGRVQMEGEAGEVIDTYQNFVSEARKSGRREQKQKMAEQP